MKFPIVQGSNLLRQKITLPVDLEGEWNILFIPFFQWQQDMVNTWLPFINQLEQEYEEVAYYEIPVLERMNVIAQAFINEGMRAGIPNANTRKRTITLYVDKTAFRESVGLPTEDHIHVLLIDRLGNILWRGEGDYTPEKAETLRRAVEWICNPPHVDSPLLEMDDLIWPSEFIDVHEDANSSS